MGEAMNDDEILDYALGRHEVLDPRRTDLAMEGDPRLVTRVEHLRDSLRRLLDDGDSLETPPDLAARTVAFVAKHRRRPSLADQMPLRVPFRFADFAVAASIFLAGVLTLIPAIQRSRERMNQAGCVFNLQQLGNSLAQYASLHPFLPYPPTHRPDAHSGMFAVMLHDAGLLDDPKLLDCPCNGPCPHAARELISFDQVDKIRRTDPNQYQSMLGWDYAYNLGYRHASGVPGPVEVVLASRVPLLADKPDHDNFRVINDGNSPNHGGRGQNVLFGDGSVHWFLTRRISPQDPDVFLNNDQQPLPGLSPLDSVLVPSKMPFQPR